MINVLIQPASGPMRDALEMLATSAKGGKCSIVSAWATPDGLALTHDLLQRHNVGLERAILGINRGFTSARAFRAALAVAASSGGSVFYYLDGKLAGPIFHAKVWWWESSAFRGALVGSANLTREGLLDNVEAGIMLTDEGARGRNEASAALDELKRHIDALASSRYSVRVDDEVIGRLVEIGAVPETSERARREDGEDAGLVTTSADELLGLREPRARSGYRPITPLPNAPGNGARTAGVRVAVAAVPPGSRLRYVRRYGLSEANRVKKYQRDGGAAGTFEVNLTMESRAEQQFWGYPDKFITTATAREWSPRVRLITVRDGREVVTLIPAARLWARLRDARESEVRFRFTNSAAVRDAFPSDIDESTLFVVDAADDGEADYEVRLIGRSDPGYAGLRPLETYEYRII